MVSISGATKVPLVFKAISGQLYLGDSPMGLCKLLEKEKTEFRNTSDGQSENKH